MSPWIWLALTELGIASLVLAPFLCRRHLHDPYYDRSARRRTLLGALAIIVAIAALIIYTTLRTAIPGSNVIWWLDLAILVVAHGLYGWRTIVSKTDYHSAAVVIFLIAFWTCTLVALVKAVDVSQTVSYVETAARHLHTVHATRT